ncbi:hypothetical protein Bca101_046561 [Brassica carinata]
MSSFILLLLPLLSTISLSEAKPAGFSTFISFSVNNGGGRLGNVTVSVDGATVPEEIRSFAIANLEEEEEKEKEKGEFMVGVNGNVNLHSWSLEATSVPKGLVFFAIWAAFRRKSLVMAMQEECGIKTKEFEYEKMEAVMSKTMKTIQVKCCDIYACVFRI